MMHTERLDLEATTLDHLDAELIDPARLADMLGVSVPPGWPPGHYDEDAMRFFHDRLSAEGPSADGWYGWYAILRGVGGAPGILVAGGGYFGPPAGGEVEIGYSVVESFRGRGFARELTGALVDRARGTPGVSRVLAHADRGNVASHAVLYRHGFRCVGDGREPESLRFELDLALDLALAGRA